MIWMEFNFIVHFSLTSLSAQFFYSENSKMEIESKDGSKALLKEGFTRVLGRGLGFKSNDRTVSRRHVSLQPQSSAHNDDTMVCFEVIGKNPIWVYNITSGEIMVYRRSERGEMEKGDMFCLSANNPFWLTLKRTGVENRVDFENELAESLQSSSSLIGIEELELETVDVSNIDDPIKGLNFNCFVEILLCFAILPHLAF